MLMSSPKVSILIPVHNGAEFLATTIQSALEQSWSNKEIIIVDDGSTDDSLQIARSFESDIVRVFARPCAGACRARNYAFQQSNGDYIQYLDADDLLSPDKIRNQLINIDGNSGNVVLSCRFFRFYSDKMLPDANSPRGYLDRTWTRPIEWLLNEWHGKGSGNIAIWLTPRAIIEKVGPWDESLLINQDGEFFCRVLLASSEIRFSESSFVYYRSGNSTSISQSISQRKAQSLLRSYHSYQEHILKVEDSERTRTALASRYRSFVYAFYDSYSELAEEARRAAIELGVKKLPMTGGVNFRTLAYLVGFDNAVRIRSAMTTAKKKLIEWA